jgi:hypothetical protein
MADESGYVPSDQGQELIAQLVGGLAVVANQLESQFTRGRAVIFNVPLASPEGVISCTLTFKRGPRPPTIIIPGVLNYRDDGGSY